MSTLTYTRKCFGNKKIYKFSRDIHKHICVQNYRIILKSQNLYTFYINRLNKRLLENRTKNKTSTVVSPSANWEVGNLTYENVFQIQNKNI